MTYAKRAARERFHWLLLCGSAISSDLGRLGEATRILGQVVVLQDHMLRFASLAHLSLPDCFRLVSFRTAPNLARTTSRSVRRYCG